MASPSRFCALWPGCAGDRNIGGAGRNGDERTIRQGLPDRRRGPDSAINGRGAGKLLGVALTDVLNDGLSMVYSFFDPEECGRSLGTLMILDHIERARRMGLPYVYLGYWVDGSRKMDYKGRFLPQERLMPDSWVRFTK